MGFKFKNPDCWELVLYMSEGVIVKARGINTKGVEYLFVGLYQRVMNARYPRYEWDNNVRTTVEVPQPFPPRSTKSWKFSINKDPVNPESLKVEAFKYYPISKESFNAER